MLGVGFTDGLGLGVGVGLELGVRVGDRVGLDLGVGDLEIRTRSRSLARPRTCVTAMACHGIDVLLEQGMA